MGPCPAKAVAAGIKALKRAADPSFCPHEEWRNIPDEIRNQLANLLQVNYEQISLNTSVSEVVSTIAAGYPLSENDEVLILKNEYPSDVLPWLLHSEQRGFKIRWIENSDLENEGRWNDLFTSRTKILVLSQVAFNTGRFWDVTRFKSVLKNRNIFFILDASQSFGGRPLSKDEIECCDVISCVSYKWLLGPYGGGFAYYSNSAIETITRQQASWLTSPNSQSTGSLLNYTTKTIPGARKFDRGQTSNIVYYKTWGEALKLLKSWNLNTISNHNLSLVEEFKSNFPRIKYDMITPLDSHSNILCLKAKNADTDRLQEKLRSKNIDVSVREGNLRISFHLFNTTEQVHKLLNALDEASL